MSSGTTSVSSSVRWRQRLGRALEPRRRHSAPRRARASPPRRARLACSAAVRSSASAASAPFTSRVERRVLALEPVEARREPRLGAAKRREIMEVFDLVVAVHGRDEPAQARRGDGGELRRRRASRGVVVGRQLEPDAVAAQVIVHLEPERHGRLHGARATSRADGDRARTRAPRASRRACRGPCSSGSGARPETLPRDQAEDHDDQRETQEDRGRPQILRLTRELVVLGADAVDDGFDT